MNWKIALTAAALASAAAFAAQAGVVLSDNFNTGPFVGNWTGDSIFSSPSSYSGYTTGSPVFPGTGSNASTDHVGPGFFGNLCQGGVGGCVDLDGSTGSGNDPAGVLQSLTSFAAGTYHLTFDLSGNQRGTAAQMTDVYLGSQLVFSSGLLPSSFGFTTENVTFASATGGHLTFVEVGPSDQNGNVLDNVTFNSVPEPAAWALMLVGFGALGVMLRRRGNAAIA